jgi:glycosyltransferase involved in cell wall biosynthesis
MQGVSNRLRLLVVAPQTRYSMRPYVLETCRALSSMADVSVLLLDRFEEGNLPFSQIELPHGTSRLSKIWHFLNPLTYARLRGLFAKGKYDLVHVLNAEGYPYSLFVTSLARRRSVPVVVTVHDPIPHSGSWIDSANAVLAGYVLRTADAVHIHKDFQLESVRRRASRLARLAVIPHGNIAHTYLQLSRGVPGDGTVLFFGRIEEYKGLDVLLDAIPLTPSSLRFVIAGPGRLTAQQAQKIEGLGPRVRLENRYLSDQEVADCFDAASLLVLPYLQVTQSALPGIAKAFQLPIVASDLPGFQDEITDRDGVLFEPGSAANLATAIVAALVRPPRQAQARAHSLPFTQVAGLLDELYRDVKRARG